VRLNTWVLADAYILEIGGMPLHEVYRIQRSRG